MEYLQYALVPFAVVVLMPVIFELIRKKVKKEENKLDLNNFIICTPLFIGVIILTMTIIFTIILILLNIYDLASIYVNMIMIPFLLSFFVGCYAIAREKIIINEDTIKVVPFIGKTRYYNFKDIKKIKKVITQNLIIYKVFSDTIIFSVSNSNVGFNLFVEKIKNYKIILD